MKKSKHSLSHYKLLSCDQGQLIPIGVRQVIPGDVFQHSTSALIRVSPLATPVMHPVRARIHHFFVPNRIIWDEFEPFITGGPDGTNASVHPYITTPSSTGFALKSLADYLGVKPGTPDRQVSALPFRAYALIYNEYYRDQDLNTKLTISKASGSDTTTNVALQNACWERDRFTLARPTPQKGPAVTLPLGTEAPVFGKNMPFNDADAGNNRVNIENESGALKVLAANSNSLYGGSAAAGTGQLMADLSTATAATITELRTAFALQQFAENRSLYGSRYTDYLAVLGVRSSDARLQRPEYLGGGVQTIQFSEVVQSSPGEFDSEESPLGTLGGHGIGAMGSNTYRRFFEEHGFVISLLSVIPKTVYVQGIEKHWLYQTKEDYFQPELQFVGQDTVQYQEVYADHATPTGTFGYIDRYDELRRAESTVHGEFRDTLDDWHMGRIFSSDPALNATFVTANPTDRIYSATTPNELQVMVKHTLRAKRIVAKVGTPRSF